MDPDVVEISPPPPVSRPPRMRNRKEIVLHDVIEIDEDDSAELLFLDKVADKSNKGKAVKVVSDGYSDYQTKEAMVNFFGPSGVEPLGSLDGVESSKSFDPASLIDLDGHSSEGSCDDDDDYIGLLQDEFMDVDQYSMLQAHFDSVDIPPGIEAPIPFLFDNNYGESSLARTTCPMQSYNVDLHGINTSSSSSPWSSKLVQINKNSNTASNPILQTEVGSVDQHSGMDLSSNMFLSQFTQSKKKAAVTLQHRGSASSPPHGVLSKTRYRKSFPCKKKQLVLSSSANYDPVNQSDAMKLPSGVEPSFWEPFIPEKLKKKVGTSFPVPINMPHPPFGLKSPLSWSHAPQKSVKPLFNHFAHSDFFDPLSSGFDSEEMADVLWFDNLHCPAPVKNEATVGSSTNNVQATTSLDRDEILRKYGLFKQFDTVEGHSDHHYARDGSSLKPSSKNWAKRIQEEWKILEKDLPDTIFVRVYETRMDLLRAVIIGAEGTPYHDGLFFFDVFFPGNYPNVPPHVFYHSGGLRLNPNLYNTGKVCLSLLNTWSGNKNEKWIPGTSTMLQVLVSIQGLILNTKPYFNEPGYAQMSGSESGEKRSLQYNESTFILSLKTMMYTIRRPPKHFENFVMGHFCNRAHDILVACKAYMDGAQVGCLVRGGVQDVDEGDKSCSRNFKNSLPGYVNYLVKEFSQLGANDCEKYLLPNVNLIANGSIEHAAP
ncbi:uncharacterized protein LOC133796789 [Humulus lupulus]|uniref:uncharacterized protein LOC133796789 n=1 Tax=Humulus lupulus TaxID=3486 RepID=UPI002B4179A3|nr:uncharacterized protein LOC133796789 [Humulus lupulus]XP_062090433.1 uncharacterized protein LOC133796789 [Humulus lupulus]XP_062090434.1 uncharacterized protein LOC133796789 [Humulus lupulus]